MSGFVLTRRALPDGRLDLSALLPARLAALSVAEVERLKLGEAASCCVADVFSVRCGAPERLVVEGGSDRFDSVGACLDRGEVRLEGDAGQFAGRSMTGGRLIVQGQVGGLAASGLRGGVMEVAKHAGPLLGGAAPGAQTGMAGGIVVVRGSAGPRAGDRMRRGLLVVEGDAGEGVASRMVAGTVIVCGTAGQRAGILMRRGTLLLGGLAAPLAPTFVPAMVDAAGVFTRLLRRAVAPFSDAAAELCVAAAERFLGDMATLGRGEVFLRQ